jgi:hypothetical protein
MIITWKIIADHLRRELADYGGLLHLYDQQQQGLFNRQADTVLRLSTAIEEQVVQVAESRRLREQAVEKFARAHGQPANATLRDLLPLIESDARPLLEALIGEVNLLLHRVRRTNRQNHTLLSRTVALHRETLQQLRPNAFTKTYTPGGLMTVSSGRPPSTLCVAG